MTLRAAEARYREAARLAAAAAVLAGDAWDRVPLGQLDSWNASRLAAQVTALQLTIARGADGYLDSVLDEQGLDAEKSGSLAAASVAGVAGDGRSLTSLLDEPRIRAKMLIGRGLGAQDAWDRARDSLRLMSVTAVQDAGRAADSVAMVARPKVTGYVRMLNLPSCSRCVILAGKFFRWNTGFQRHPRCDCRHIPSTEAMSGDLRLDPLKAIQSGQVTGLSKADLRAILQDGADPIAVINAHRGMYTADVFGQHVKATLEGVTVRGATGRALLEAGVGTQGVAAETVTRLSREGLVQRDVTRQRVTVPRLRPETIYRRAGGDREKAIAQLKRFGYLR